VVCFVLQPDTTEFSEIENFTPDKEVTSASFVSFRCRRCFLNCFQRVCNFVGNFKSVPVRDWLFVMALKTVNQYVIGDL